MPVTRPEACLDPWCAVRLSCSQEVLFGFATRHPVTGGLSWTRSSPIRNLDVARSRAVTASGRRYELGRRIELQDVPDQGEEAWLAFDLLIGSEAVDDAVPPISADPERDACWIAACKMARRLGVAAPSRAPSRVAAFLRDHSATYLALRSSGARS